MDDDLLTEIKQAEQERELEVLRRRLAKYETPLTGDIEARALKLLRRKRGAPATLDELADALDVAPKHALLVVETLGEKGYRVAFELDDPTVKIAQDAQLRATRNSYNLLAGEELTVGIISDTHLSSKEHAAGPLNSAYDEFQRRGITTVLHAGDLVAGRGIYRTQDQDLHHFTFETQVDNAVDTYPHRDGIQTLLISGNHDIEGEFGKIGADPVQAVANRRDDLTYLGSYAAAINLPNGAHMMLVHGRGGGGYAMSYKPQRWVEGLAPGRKPGLVVFGHWHIMGWFQHRSVNLLLGGCFEWQTSLLVRLGLQPAVGFWIATLTLADDGSMTKVVPEWHQFYAGRTE